MTAIAAGLWVSFTYFANEKELQLTRQEDARRQDTSRLLEAKKPFNEQQLKLYLEVAQVAGRLATADPSTIGSDEWNKDYRRFRELVSTEVRVVSDDTVDQAMREFLNSLDHVKGNHNEPAWYMSGSASILSTALKKSLSATWIVALNELTEVSAKLCEGNPGGTFCPKDSQIVKACEGIVSWINENKCLSYSVDRLAEANGGPCGYEVVNIKCTKRK